MADALVPLAGQTLGKATAQLAADPSRPPYRIASWEGRPCTFAPDSPFAEPNPYRVNLHVVEGVVKAVTHG